MIAEKSAVPMIVEKAEVQLTWYWAALMAVVFASTGHLLVKFGLISTAQSAAGLNLPAKIVHYLLQPAIAAGLSIYGLGTFFWISAVSRREISVLYPITALNYVMVTMGGKFLFGETVSALRWLGIAVVVTGVALLQLSARGERQ